MKIIVFHGFGTTPKTSNFCNCVREHYETDFVEVISPKYNYWSKSPVEDIMAIARDLKGVVDSNTYFFGISLGGFMARQMAIHYDSPLAMFNPSIKPWKDLSMFVNSIPIHKRILVKYLWSASLAESANSCSTLFSNKHVKKQALVLTKDDLSVKWSRSFEFFKNKALYLIHDTGGHALNNSLLNDSLNYLDDNWIYDEKEKNNKSDQF